MKHLSLSLCLLFALFSAVLGGTTGKIAGLIVDQRTGEPLAGVNVTVAGYPLGASTDQDGYYHILNILPGTYQVTAQYLGYQEITKTEVFVQVDLTTSLNFELPEKTLEMSESIVVVAEREAVQKDITSTVINMSTDQIQKLPVSSVNDLLSLQAGVVDDNGLHVRGGRSGELAYLVDGHRVEDPLFGGNPTDINNEAIQQMELLTGTFNAEYGNAMSGIVNIVTKENFGDITGRVRYRMSKLGLEDASDNLNARHLEGFLSGAVWTGAPVGVTLSGRMRLQDNYYQSGLLTTDSTGLRPSGLFSGEPFGYSNVWSFFGKAFYRINPQMKLSVSYNYDRDEWQSYIHSYKYIPDSAYVRNSNSDLVALNFIHTVSQDLFYEVRMSYYTYNYLKNYSDLYFTEYSAAGGRTYNGEFNLSSGNEEYIDQKSKSYTIKADVSYQLNRYNLFKAGASFVQQDLDYFWIYGPKRSANNQYINNYNEKPIEGAIYIQDKIEFESIILNLGLRYDFYNPEVTYIADPNDRESSVTTATLKTQLSPRLGIAYPISENTVFHFAYGHFFQRPPYEILYEDLQRRMDVNKPLIGNPDLNPENTISYEFGVRSTVSPAINLQATVFSRKIKDLLGVAWQFKEPFVPLQYAYYVNEDFAYVRGFEFDSRFRFRNLSLNANYTYQIAEGSSSSQQERFTGAYDVKGRQSLQFYPLSFDQRHIVNAIVNISFAKEEGPFGWAPAVFENAYLSLIFKFATGLPYTYNPTRKRYETDLNNARQPDTYFLDLEAQKDFYIGPIALGFYLQIYNLLDLDNVRYVYSYTGLPDDSGQPESYEYMADPTNYYPPRTIFLGFSVRL
jgi:outer membrane receptor for ferrienterochelin and colicin